MHGGVRKENLGKEDVDTVRKGCGNLARHVRNVKQFGVPVVVGINRFNADTDAEIKIIQEVSREHGAEAIECLHWADGSAGIEALAQHVVKLVEGGTNQFVTLYDDDVPLWEKAKTVATHLCGADDIVADQKVRKQFAELQEKGYGHFPVCMTKTQYSLSADPGVKDAPLRGTQCPSARSGCRRGRVSSCCLR